MSVVQYKRHNWFCFGIEENEKGEEEDDLSKTAANIASSRTARNHQ